MSRWQPILQGILAFAAILACILLIIIAVQLVSISKRIDFIDAATSSTGAEVIGIGRKVDQIQTSVAFIR